MPGGCSVFTVSLGSPDSPVVHRCLDALAGVAVIGAGVDRTTLMLRARGGEPVLGLDQPSRRTLKVMAPGHRLFVNGGDLGPDSYRVVPSSITRPS